MNVARPRLPAAFPYVGGKWRMAPRIVRMLPDDHEVFVEVFGGSGAVLFAKERSKVEVLNDCDGDVVNFFRVLRDEALTDRLMERLLNTPYSRKEYAEMCRQPPPGDPVLRAWRFWAIARQCYGGYRPANHGCAFAGATVGRWRRSLSSRHQFGGDAATLHNKIDELARFRDRLLGVYIEDALLPGPAVLWDRGVLRQRPLSEVAALRVGGCGRADQGPRGGELLRPRIAPGTVPGRALAARDVPDA